MSPKPNRAEAAPHRAHAGALLAQVRLYTLTTVRVVARNFFGGSDVAATRALGALRARGELHRYGAGVGTYYTTASAALSPEVLAESFAVLWFCRMHRPPRALVSPREFRAIVAGMRDASVPLEREPRFVRCYRGNGRLHLLRVQPLSFDRHEDAVARALVLLQDVVRVSAFAPWWYWARHELLRLVYLVRNEAAAQELARWTREHPLVSRVGGTPIPIPVEVFAIPLCGGAS